MLSLLSRIAACLTLLGVLSSLAFSATLEKLSVDQMSVKSTLIVRGRVTSCAGESHGTLIYTRCKATVSERWKGTSGADVSFLIPGGSARGLVQTFTGTPKLYGGAEYVLFLWAGRSGVNQIIGLTQGLFDLKLDSRGQAIAQRGATSELMLDRAGVPVQDLPVSMSINELRAIVNKALGQGNTPPAQGMSPPPAGTL